MMILKRLQADKTILLAIAVDFPLIFFGYGTDVDIYRVLEIGRTFLATADYVPSRHPGYVIHEMMTLVLDTFGGSILTNLGTLILSLFAIHSFMRLCQHYKIANSQLLTTIFIIHPLFWINSTNTIDYVWAIGFLLSGFYLLTNRRFSFAGLAFGLAIGSRFTSFVAVIVILVFMYVSVSENRKRILLVSAIAGLIGALSYVLPFDFTGWELRILEPSIGDPIHWTPFLRYGRFVYKNIYFWGLLPSLFLFFLSIHIIKSRKEFTQKGLFLMSSLTIIGYQILFLNFPIAMEYLLTTLPFWLFLLGIGLQHHRGLIRTFLILLLMTNFLNINIAKPDNPNQATGASYGIWIEEGYMIEEIRARIELIDCKTKDCFTERMYSTSRTNQ